MGSHGRTEAEERQLYLVTGTFGCYTWIVGGDREAVEVWTGGGKGGDECGGIRDIFGAR